MALNDVHQFTQLLRGSDGSIDAGVLGPSQYGEGPRTLAHWVDKDMLYSLQLID